MQRDGSYPNVKNHSNDINQLLIVAKKIRYLKQLKIKLKKKQNLKRQNNKH
jgi:hypothetical protein